MESEKNIPVEHQNVPVAHQGLHNFLYSSDAEHSSATPSGQIEDDRNQVMPVEEWRSRSLTNGVKVAGVYAVLDCKHQTQYVGYSRDIRQSLEGHIVQNGVEVCAFIRVQTVKFPQRQVMEALRDEWIASLGHVPPGNQGIQGTWASTVGEAARSTMSTSDRNAYEDKKLKLRKAMADTTLIDELEKNETQDDSMAERHRKLEAAVENDDWTSVVGS